MENIVLELTPDEAFALRTLLYTEIAGADDGPRGTLSRIENKLNAEGVGYGRLVSHINEYGHMHLNSIHRR